MDRFEEHREDLHIYPHHYLHSSMDRFEARLFQECYKLILHLHSSMDRFEANGAMVAHRTFNDLHSSMDRFEEM